jgi:hypothetical protein
MPFLSNIVRVVLSNLLWRKLESKYGKKAHLVTIIFFIVILLLAYFIDRYQQNEKIKEFCSSLTLQVWNNYSLIYPDKYYSECKKMVKRAGGVDALREKLKQ